MRVLQVGNFGVYFSTECEFRKAFEALGHEVESFQENEPGAFLRVAERLRGQPRPDVVAWTRTGWDPPVPHAEQWEMLNTAKALGVPTLGLHLDKWHSLDRVGQIAEEPFFRVALLATADGGYQDEWAAAGVNHRWMPPGVSEFECGGGTPNRRLASDVAFVGSWRGSYHKEWPHRDELVAFLRTTYRGRCRFWGGPGRGMRGPALRDLVASVKVFVGDSCGVGGRGFYTSDRVPETLGRGGFLLHPHVEGVTDGTLYTDGEHLRTWPLGDWGELRRLIDFYVVHDDERRAIAEAGRRHVLENHTYGVRLRSLLEQLQAEGLIGLAR